MGRAALRLVLGIAVTTAVAVPTGGLSIASSPPPAPAGEAIPPTGANALPLKLLLASLAVAAGGAVVMLGRRRGAH